MKTARITVLALSGLLGVAGAAVLSGQGEPAPKPMETAPAGEHAAAKVFEVDAVHSSVIFKIQHVGLNNVYGRFDTFTGRFSLDPASPEEGSFDITVQAGSVDTNQEQRDEHLRDEMFFNTEKFPTITFKSTAIERSTADYLVLKGDMTLLGVTKPVSATLVYAGQRELPKFGLRAGVEATFTIKRSDFGMTEAVAEGMLGDEVTLTVSLQGVAQ